MSRLMLVVEDNPANQKLVLRYLTAKGYRAVGAGTTEEADAALAAERPGCVLVDLSLPGEDGLSWVRRVRQRGETEVPMIAFTAHAMAADQQRALDAGCQGVLLKPLELKALLDLAQRYLGPASAPH